MKFDEITFQIAIRLEGWELEWMIVIGSSQEWSNGKWDSIVKVVTKPIVDRRRNRPSCSSNDSCESVVVVILIEKNWR